MKNKKQDASSVAHLYDDQDDHGSDPLTKSNIINKHFLSVFANEDISNMQRQNKSTYPSMSHITIDTSGVENLIHIKLQVMMQYQHTFYVDCLLK